MSDCCSSEKSDCTPASAQSPSKTVCPRCGQAGRQVSTLTLKHQVRSDLLAAVNGKSFQFCGTPACPVVYFSADNTVLTTSEVRRPVTQKDPARAPVCYCFGFTPGMVAEEIQTTGKSTVVQRIAEEMKSDYCACEIRNPQGSCCLGNVKAAVKTALAVNRTENFKTPQSAKT
ncbi:MAG TPA: hypothetical protein VKC60_17290 [Opitutaceae bacterium]|nr:hypothetical protein [Opitutaceae bacterium]